MLSLTLLVLLTTYSKCLGRVIDIQKDSIVNIENYGPGSVTINGIKYRESSSLSRNSQLTIPIRKGVYDFGDSDVTTYQGEIFPNPEGNLKDLIVSYETIKTIYTNTFTLNKKGTIGIGYNIELSERLSCQTPNTHTANKVKIVLEVDGNPLIAHSGVSMYGVKEIVLDKGFHTVELKVENTDVNDWGSIPSTGNGFVHGRYVLVWKSNGEKEKYLSILDIKPPVAAWVFVGSFFGNMFSSK